MSFRMKFWDFWDFWDVNFHPKISLVLQQIVSGSIFVDEEDGCCPVVFFSPLFIAVVEIATLDKSVVSKFRVPVPMRYLRQASIVNPEGHWFGCTGRQHKRLDCSIDGLWIGILLNHLHQQDLSFCYTPVN